MTVDDRFICWNCGDVVPDGTYYDDETDQYYCWGCLPAEGPYPGPYDDEGERAYSDVARGEEGASAIPVALNNLRYPPRQSQDAPSR